MDTALGLVAAVGVDADAGACTARSEAAGTIGTIGLSSAPVTGAVATVLAGMIRTAPERTAPPLLMADGSEAGGALVACDAIGLILAVSSAPGANVGTFTGAPTLHTNSKSHVDVQTSYSGFH